ncbi:AAA domain (dynein-related subfamily) [Paenibacillus sp. UNCCL117]|uniref:McrB family protein n=1 Tax=unclassified Paenibacillus TaxID=185978 RepID=UPI00088696DC|nr:MULTISPECIES: AAA family ATPase [unclassified Paenibacillus]SDE38539.1 AAA domain (dynein-related subfamily) [Paenibacillus sp. cl123]SFW65108.1 AAA domain (dynein-related subfamily) [Paenibacillus sp. UNCCL117]
MIKKNRSWWKDDAIPNLIGRKQIDWSIFEYGTHIPMDFHEDFVAANQHIEVPLGQSHRVFLIEEGNRFECNLSRINQKKQKREALQIRYDTNSELKEYMITRFNTTYNYLSNKRSQAASTKNPITVPEEFAEYLEFYATDKPFVYEVRFITNDTPIPEDQRSIWWVCQGTSYNSQKQEGILWAPLKDSRGKTPHHWETMKDVEVNDIILHYSNGALRAVSQVQAAAVERPKPASLSDQQWEETGRLVVTEYHDLNPPIPLEAISQDLLQLHIAKGPINKIGGVNQGYLFPFTLQGLSIVQNKSKGTPWPEFTLLSEVEEVEEEVELVTLSDEETKAHLQVVKSYIQQQGFTYPELLIENFYLSLKTKPFVILAGISGTGKTKLIQEFAEALGATEANGQFTLIPVRPDWNDPSDLIGYKDLSGTFRRGKLTYVLEIASASENQRKPYFICLDEMNLARVEHYFSDLLSILETQRWQEGRIVTDTVVAEDQVGRNIGIPENVFFIGTVNMDETTHPFSKKVLDRANTIEFNHIQLDNFSGLEEAAMSNEEEQEYLYPTARFLISNYLQLKDAYTEYKGIIQSTVSQLVKINTILESIHAHVGFRVRDSICFYLIYNARFSLMTTDEALDLQIMQKILPRIQGNNSEVKKVIIELLLFSLNGSTSNSKEYVDGERDIEQTWAKQVKESSVKYPQTARKLIFMLRRLDHDGFTSFWVS